MTASPVLSVTFGAPRPQSASGRADAHPIPASGPRDAESATTRAKDRGLSTARAVLCVLSYVAESPHGVTARDVADRLEKSLSTAYHLLASLEAEGFIARVGRAGSYHLVADKLGGPPPAADLMSSDLERMFQDAMQQVFAHTGRRTSIGVFSDGGVALVQDIGRQGLPRMNNLEKPLIRSTAHALAVGKLLLAEFDDQELAEWVTRNGLRSFTCSTIVDPLELGRELAQVRSSGIAADLGEYDAAFGSLAVSIPKSPGRPAAAIVVTVTRHQFAVEREKLQRTLLDVTRELNEALAS